MKIKNLLLAVSAFIVCGNTFAEKTEDTNDEKAFRELLTDSLSKANVTTWTLPESLEPNAKMNFLIFCTTFCSIILSFISSLLIKSR